MAEKNPILAVEEDPQPPSQPQDDDGKIKTILFSNIAPLVHCLNAIINKCTYGVRVASPP